MVWKDDVLAFGDLAGRLGVWDLARSQCRQTGFTQSTRGPVLRFLSNLLFDFTLFFLIYRCVFSRLAGDGTLAVQHPTSIVLWDTDKLQPLQSFQHVGLSIVDVDMCGVVPVYIASDGMFRFADDVGKSSSANRSIFLFLRFIFIVKGKIPWIKPIKNLYHLQNVYGNSSGFYCQ